LAVPAAVRSSAHGLAGVRSSAHGRTARTDGTATFFRTQFQIYIARCTRYGLYPACGHHLSLRAGNLSNSLCNEVTWTVTRMGGHGTRVWLKRVLFAEINSVCHLSYSNVFAARRRRRRDRHCRRRLRENALGQPRSSYQSLPISAISFCESPRKPCVLLLQDLLQSCSRGGGRERVLFIGTQFSILYTFMYSPA